MVYTCQVCTKTRATRAGDIPWVWPIPYVAAVRTGSTATKRGRDKLAELEALSSPSLEEMYQLERFRREMASPEVFYCCAECADAHNGPGKYQGNSGRNAVGTALVLDALAGISGEEEQMSSDGWGYCGMFGRYLLYEDSSGFVTFEELATWLDAYKRFNDLYAEGWGYSEDDACIASDGRVYFGGKELDVARHWNSDKEVTETRRYAAIALEMHRQGFYPDVWKETYDEVHLCQDFYSRTANVDAILNAWKGR